MNCASRYKEGLWAKLRCSSIRCQPSETVLKGSTPSRARSVIVIDGANTNTAGISELMDITSQDTTRPFAEDISKLLNTILVEFIR